MNKKYINKKGSELKIDQAIW